MTTFTVRTRIALTVAAAATLALSLAMTAFASGHHSRHRNGAAGKADARAARAPLAAPHQVGKSAGLEAVALDAAVDHHLRRIDAVAPHSASVGVLARRPGGLGGVSRTSYPADARASKIWVAHYRRHIRSN